MKSLKRAPRWAFWAWVVASTGCTAVAPPEPKSEIVTRVEKAGAGNLSAAATPAMQEWLGRHRDLADQVESLCKPARERADVNWSASTEGRLCSAAHNLAFFRYRRMEGDGRAFHAGLK